MDFEDSPDEAAFRAEARAFLERNAKPRDLTAARPRMPGDSPEHVARCKAWQRVLYDGGWAGITWPKQFGGRGGTAIQQVIFEQEQARFDVATGVFAVGIGMAGPTIIAHASDEQKQRWLDPLLRGDEIWCQLFSEPGAGSDLASLATKAVRDGDDFVVNGQKVWTSGAHHADRGILLARTNPDVPKHKGITYFVVDMDTPGIEVRPIKQINGGTHFNEVFLTDVRVPAANVVGAVDGGWAATHTTMGAERGLIGGGMGQNIESVLSLASACGAGEHPVLRNGVVDAWVRFQLLRYLGYRVQTALSKGATPGAEASILKLLISRHVAATGDLVLAMQGAAGMLYDADAIEGGVWQNYFLGQFGVRIGGGTDEVQRNAIGEHMLGLPREPRPDKDAPFRTLAHSK
jgi:alkylation response protein AidB-like acyl-CoA dehydrogenase